MQRTKYDRAYIEKLKSYVPAETLAKGDSDFFTEYGMRNFWRIPLVYPYSVQSIGEMDKDASGWLMREKYPAVGSDNGTRIVNDISDFAFDGKAIVMRIGWDFHKPRAVPFWVVFEFATAKAEQFQSEAEAFAAAHKVGYEGPDKVEPLPMHYERTFGPIKGLI